MWYFDGVNTYLLGEEYEIGDYGFAAVASNVDMRDLNAVRRSYCNSLREMEKTLDLLLENKTLFAQQT